MHIRNEAELLEKVVQRVLTKVPEPAMHVAKYATGLGQKMEDLENTVLFQQEQQPVEVKVVGIAGVGGIGKTTLANEFFKCKRSHYAGSSFLADVREKASRSLLPSLQSKLIKDLKGINREIGRWEEGTGILETCLSSCHALIILDDVDDADQLDAFLPIKGVLDPKSLILVTSRDKHVLRSAGIAKSSIDHLKGLSKTHSQELFCSHAFFRPYPRPGFENLVGRFVNACDGLPLSLKVFGSLLCEKGRPYWEEKLNELQKLPRKIEESLKITYDSLDQEEQQIFLDIACFAIGEETDKWLTIWGRSAGLQTLEDRCLVEVVEVASTMQIYDHYDYGAEEVSKKTMRMHDHLRDMGRNIAEEVSMPRRLWRSIQDVHDLFEKPSLSSVIPKVRGITMRSGATLEESSLRSRSEIPLNKISSSQAFRIRELQLLQTEGEFVEGILSRVHSPNLIWFRWNDCPCSSLPSWIPMDHLKVLEVRGRELKKLWHSDSQASPLQLRELYVDAPLLEFPKSIGNLNFLEKIVLTDQYYYHSRGTADLPPFLSLPEEIFHVRSLKCLQLTGYFRVLPNEFGNLTNLQRIVLSGCRGWKKLPGSFTNLTNLQHLQLSGCDRLKRLPKSLGDLTNLQCIILDGCKSLKKLPDSLGDLKNLQRIRLKECKSLEVLPNSFGNLANLQRITLRGCESFEVLADSFGNLTNLLQVELYGCKRLKKLPDSFTDLMNLQGITLEVCESLELLSKSFGNLTNLQHINLSGCESLEDLPDSFGNLRNLRHIQLSGFKRLKKLPDSFFTDLKNLQEITLRACDSLEALPDSFGNLRNLRSMNLHDCNRWKRLPNTLGNLTNLQRIELYNCNRLKRLPNSLAVLTNLQRINIFRCKSLKKLPNSLGHITNLQEITLDGCESLEVFPDSVGNLKNLQRICLSACSLNTLPDSFGHLRNLQSIVLTACRNLKMLPSNSFGNLTNLRGIDLSDCESLEKLPGSSSDLTNLVSINLRGCKNLKKLPISMGHFTNLKSINLSGCKSLKKLPKSLGLLTNLRSIDFSGCKSLKKLPNSLGNLLQLLVLDLSHCCMSLTTTLGNITSLLYLDFSGCVQMEVLPAQLEHQKSLTMLNLLGTNIKELSNAHTVCLTNLACLYLGSPLLKELPPSLGCLSSLKILLLHGCQELKRLPDSVGQLTQLRTLEISKCGIHQLPGLMEMNNLQTLRVRCCPLRELPFKEETAPGRKRKRRAKDKGLIGLKTLELYCTKISEVSFPEGVCTNLEYLEIKCCNDLVKVGSLPATVGHLILRGCGALSKIEGFVGLAKLLEVDMRGCYNIRIEELPHFENSTLLFTPADTYNCQQHEEKEMAALQRAGLPDRFRWRLDLFKHHVNEE